MTEDFNAGCASASLSIREDATAAPERGVRNNGTQAHFAQGFGGGKPSTSKTVATQSLLAKPAE